MVSEVKFKNCTSQESEVVIQSAAAILQTPLTGNWLPSMRIHFDEILRTLHLPTIFFFGENDQFSWIGHKVYDALYLIKSVINSTHLQFPPRELSTLQYCVLQDFCTVNIIPRKLCAPNFCAQYVPRSKISTRPNLTFAKFSPTIFQDGKFP